MSWKPHVLVTAVVASMLVIAGETAASTVHRTKRVGEPRAGKALVYVIREKAFVGGGVGMFVFADDQLLAFVRNSTYAFAHIDPGLRLVWGDTASSLEVQFVAGETYYLAAGPMNPFALLTEAEAKKSIEKVNAYIESDQKDLDNAAKKIAKRYEKAQKREARKEKAAVEEVAVSAPASTEGLISLAANTRLEIELMENLSSSLNTIGETVWFRVVGDVDAGGQVLIPDGARVRAAIRQVKRGRSYGEQGMLDVALVSIDLDETTRVPLVGQLAAAGDSRAAGVMTGMLVGAFIKGTEAFHTAGTRFSAWTREEVWLPPAAAGTVSAHTGVTTSAREFPFGENTRRDPAPVELSFPCAAEMANVQLVSAGGWKLPQPVQALSVSRSADTCAARFSGWSVLRYVRPSADPVALHLHGRMQPGDGEVHVDIPARIVFD